MAKQTPGPQEAGHPPKDAERARLAPSAEPAVAEISHVELLAELRRRSGSALSFLTTEELCAEIERRSVGLLCCTFQVQEGNRELLLPKIKGSGWMITMLLERQIAAIDKHLHELRSKT